MVLNRYKNYRENRSEKEKSYKVRRHYRTGSLRSKKIKEFAKCRLDFNENGGQTGNGR
jgi:hypothetical protein